MDRLGLSETTLRSSLMHVLDSWLRLCLLNWNCREWRSPSTAPHNPVPNGPIKHPPIKMALTVRKHPHRWVVYLSPRLCLLASSPLICLKPTSDGTGLLCIQSCEMGTSHCVILRAAVAQCRLWRTLSIRKLILLHGGPLALISQLMMLANGWARTAYARRIRRSSS